MIIQGDVLEEVKKLKDYSIDLIFCDPPYNLGSTYKVNEENKLVLSKSADFMNKWDGLSGEYLDEMFKEFNRVLKAGGRCIAFSIDRHSHFFKYYPVKNNFIDDELLLLFKNIVLQNFKIHYKEWGNYV